MELTVQNMYGLLIRSKLLGLDEVRAMYTRWQEEARDSATNLARFAGWMVAHRYLTEYQAALLARGHADGFFLGEYKILDRLGKGRMAGVYRAQHPLGQVVAIKVLPPSKALDRNLLGRFRREARLLLKLKHPNVVRAFQVGHTRQLSGETLHYLVMEYLEGDTLEEVLQKRGKLPPAETVRLIHQTLQGLQHIHAHGLVHRDLKPPNIMLIGATPDSTLRATAKILDLGLGRAMFDAGMSEQQLTDGLTGEGVLLGTPDYMAPEQARDPRGIDIRADVYSLGCVLYQMLAGQLPFPDSNLINQMIRHATETARPLRDFNPAVPDGLQQIVGWMMAKDPNQRYPSPERAAQALQVFLAAGAPEALAAPEADPKMRPYLTWLEVNANRPREEAAARPAGAPSGKHSGKVHRSGKPGRSDKSEKLGRSKHRSKKEKEKKRPPPPPAVPTAAPLGAPAAPRAASVAAPVAPVMPPPAVPGGDLGGFDVELVPGHAEPASRGLLDRRDCLAFGLGVLAGGLAVGIGCWFAVRRGNKPAETEEK